MLLDTRCAGLEQHLVLKTSTAENDGIDRGRLVAGLPRQQSRQVGDGLRKTEMKFGRDDRRSRFGPQILEQGLPHRTRFKDAQAVRRQSFVAEAINSSG